MITVVEAIIGPFGRALRVQVSHRFAAGSALFAPSGTSANLDSVLRAQLSRLCQRVDLLPGAGQRAFVDIDSLLRPVCGHAKLGASYERRRCGQGAPWTPCSSRSNTASRAARGLGSSLRNCGISRT